MQQGPRGQGGSNQAALCWHLRMLLKSCRHLAQVGVLGGERATGVIEQASNSGVDVRVDEGGWEPPMEKLAVDVLLALPRPKACHRAIMNMPTLFVVHTTQQGAQRFTFTFGVECGAR